MIGLRGDSMKKCCFCLNEPSRDLGAKVFDTSQLF